MERGIAALLAPSSVAVVGASEDVNRVGGRPVHYLARFGFQGEVFPVNPRRATVQGRPAFRDLAALGKVPDAAVLAVPAEEAIAQVKECARLGIPAAVVMSSGFAEAGAEGRLRQERLVEAARAGGVRIIGPNAQGIANFATGAVLNFSTMFMEVAPRDGPIAIVSQSGAASVMPYAALREQGLGVRYLAATGNDSDLCAAELAEAIAGDEDVRLILVYLESVTQPQRLAAAAATARRRGAHVVVLKSGTSRRGARAAASHTGAIAGNEAALDAFLERHGIWRAADMAEFVRAAPLYLQGRDPRRGRTVVMSHSGAVGVMAADLAERQGLELTELSEATCARLGTMLPDFGTATNPLDVTAALLGDGELFPRVMDALAQDEGLDMLMVGIPVAGPGYDVPALARAAAAVSRDGARPVVASAPQASVRSVFVQAGIPSFSTEAEAIAALRQYAHHVARERKVSARPVPPPLALEHRGPLDEHESLRLLERHGIPGVERRPCASESEAVEAFRAFGSGAVAVKGCSAAIAHKTEHGLVRLGLGDEGAVREAARDCLARLAAAGEATPRVLVARMAAGRHEFALGVTVDPELGALVMIGEGGTLVELRRDVVTLLAPFTRAEAREALLGLRIGALFGGYRGMPALDADALAAAAVALGDFACAAGPRLRSVDLNPVLVRSAGEGIVAVDAVVEWS